MRVLAVMPSYSPSTVINVVIPLKYLHQQGSLEAVITTENEVTPQQVAQSDALVLCRNTLGIYRPVYELAQQLGIPMIYVLDDNILAAPEGSDTQRRYQNPKQREHYEWLLRTVNQVRAHSPLLRDLIRETYNPNVRLVWAPIDWSLVPPELPELSQKPVEIVYAAQRESGMKLFALIQDDLHQLLQKHGDQIRLHFLGYNPREFRRYPQAVFQPFEADYASYFSKFTHFGYAIGLAPMLDDAFHQCKTNVKFRDYAAAGAAGIYTDCTLYRDGVTHEQTGLFVSGEAGSWRAAVERLLDDPALLQSIRQNARRFAEDRYALASVGAMWMEDLHALPARPPLSDAMKAHIDTLKWWFTGQRKPDAPLVKQLRKMLRNVVPMRWKLAYYDLRYYIKSRGYTR